MLNPVELTSSQIAAVAVGGTTLGIGLAAGGNALAALIGGAVLTSLQIAGGGFAGLCSVAALGSAYFAFPAVLVIGLSVWAYMSTDSAAAKAAIALLGPSSLVALQIGMFYAAGATLGVAALPAYYAALLGGVTVLGGAIGLIAIIGVAALAAACCGSRPETDYVAQAPQQQNARRDARFFGQAGQFYEVDPQEHNPTLPVMASRNR